jgi:VWFA-related protein
MERALATYCNVMWKLVKGGFSGRGRSERTAILPRVIELGMALTLLPLVFYAQIAIQPRSKDLGPRSDFRVDTALVLVPISVTNPRNQPLLGLRKENFRIFDNKAEQTIAQLPMEDEPIAAALVFDRSGSMKSTSRQSRMAVREFLKLANPEDEFLLVEFNSSPRLVVPLTGDTSEIESKLLFSDAKGSTALLDAIYFSVHEIKKSKKSKKALLIISDGEDNSSRYNEAEIASIVSESDVLVYGIGSSRGGARHRSAILKNLADQTGGLFFDENPGKLPEVAKAMSDDLRSRYVAGYSPHNQRRDGLYHRLEVKVIPPPNSPKLTAHWRRGYYSPLE